MRCFLLLISLLSLTVGETPFLEALKGLGVTPFWNPLWDERLPRLFILWITGASLAVAGALTQAVFANSLASPTILGISNGASLAILSVFFFGFHLTIPLFLPVAGFIGSFFSLFLIYFLSKKMEIHSIKALLLMGIALSSFLGSIEGAILFALRGEWEFIRAVTEWKAASTYFLTWSDFHLQFPLALSGIFLAISFSQELDLLSLGEEEASHLGLNVQKTRWQIFSVIALLLGSALITLGEVPFLGLIIPHIARLMRGATHKKLLLTCSLQGAIALTTIDFITRSFPFLHLSITHLMGALGGFFFIGLLFSKRRLCY